jgi:hypothetical protein
MPAVSPALHSGDAPEPRRYLLLLGALVCAIVVAAYAAVRDLPFFSESYTHQVAARELGSWVDCWSPDLAPLRPFQHLLFFALTRGDVPDPSLARAPAFALHLASALLVYALARRLGVETEGAVVACLLFVLAPNTKNLVWVAAISGPGRVLCLLAGLTLLAERSRPAPASLGAVVAFVLGLHFHQSAVALPALVLILAWCTATGSLRARGRALLERARDPAFLVILALALAYLVYVALLREQRYHEARSFEAVPAGVAKATLALAPEDLRVPAIDGLRGRFGAAGLALGASLVSGVLGLAVLGALRGGKLASFAVLAIACDAVLPMLFSGYVQRYSYLSSALLACALGSWYATATARGRRLPRIVVCSLGLLWGLDQVRTTLAFRDGGAVVERVLAQVAEERTAVGPGVPITVVDLPDMWGREEDIPLFNWGFRLAAADRGVDGPWIQLRTKHYRTSNDSQLVTREQVDGSASTPGARVYEFDRASKQLVPWRTVEN